MVLTRRKYYNNKTKKRRFKKTKRMKKLKKYKKTKKAGGGGKKKDRKRYKKHRSKRRKIMYQLFTDVDDTLHPSGWAAVGKLNIAGVDRVGDRHKFYTCVAELHQEIQRKYHLPTVIVSANPLPDFTGKKSVKMAKALGIKKVEYNCGKLRASCRSIFSNILPTTKRNKKKKIENLHFKPMANVKVLQIITYVLSMKKQLGKQFDYRPIWIGDNGQGDLLAAKTLLEKKIIYAALIHHVDPNKVSGKSSLWYRSTPQRLFPFKNYGEAIEFLKTLRGLENIKSCRVVSESAHHLLRQASFEQAEKKNL